MEEKKVDYAVALADAALEIGAIRLWSPGSGETPFRWASGYHMPIYNDNRLLLAKHRYRMVVADGFRDVLAREGIAPELIGGTSTSGIAPASSLAQLLGLPVVIQDGNPAYVLGADLIGKIRSNPVSFSTPLDIVVSTCPFSIPPAVMDANDYGRPFAYVRQDKKDHGLKKKIEGLVRRNEVALLLDCHMGESYVHDAVETLEDAGVIVGMVSSLDISGMLEPSEVSGKTIVQVEDLVSTGGSCIDEIKEYRYQGAEVECCLAIFSYGLEESAAKFRDADIRLFPLLTYDVLLGRAIAKGAIRSDDLALLREWREDPFNWGERHGFPPVKKK